MNQKATHSTSVFTLIGSKSPWLIAALCLLPCVGRAGPASTPTPLGAGLFDAHAITPGASAAGIYALSSDGMTFVVTTYINMTYHAYLWTFNGTPSDIGSLDSVNHFTNAYAMSADGSVVVGDSLDVNYHQRAFRWTSARSAALLPPPLR